ncbi:MAG TPA: hypothetical protein VME70_14545 [Mycobacteriales bacterium]|nr:hypothetical protein [Mycobacteriales bacterium]
MADDQRQLSLFGASARPPGLDDLEGLLAGNGQLARRADAARISVVVADGWRAAVLEGELAAAFGMTAQRTSTELGVAIATPWLPGLRPLADAWARGAVKHPPAGWLLDGPRLRWWCLAAGRSAPGMYTLALGASDEHAWLSVGSALAVAGVPGVLVGPRADGPAYRIVGRRRLARLLELVGDRPAGVPDDAWPVVHDQ